MHLGIRLAFYHGDVKPSGPETAVFRSRARFASTFRRLREFHLRQLYAARSSRRKRILPSNFAVSRQGSI